MLLNRIEKALMNNPVRAALQRRVELPRLLAMGGAPPGGRVLEVGCGRGVGTELLLGTPGVDQVDAFDLDPDMVRRAEHRLRAHGRRVRLWTGDVASIEAPDDTYDAVFDFGIIHHVPAWRTAIGEVHRVLRPGGRFYAEEVLARFILHPVWRRVLEHPLEDRFDADQFARALAAHGFRDVRRRELLGSFGWFVGSKA